MTERFNRIPEEKRNRILDAAMTAFAANGYVNANTNIIAKEAGISVGSLFQYFENKEDLFRTTVTYGASVLKSTLENIMLGEEDILNKVEKVIRTIQKHSRENGKMIRLYNEMSTQSNSRMMSEVIKELEGMTAGLYSSLIEKAQKELEARTDCDPRMFAFLLDNLFMMLQFSYACDYYRERFKLYVREDIFEQDEFVVEQTLRFIKGAFTNRSDKPS
ncbi:MAG TPA: TetR/AcrR family transcriptional regulator [Mobilitalea sp.]|nr:TetR/AcrR family transcriptional regulator [Mobilitalea sp.]